MYHSRVVENAGFKDGKKEKAHHQAMIEKVCTITSERGGGGRNKLHVFCRCSDVYYMCSKE
jgi:hypothetical protein